MKQSLLSFLEIEILYDCQGSETVIYSITIGYRYNFHIETIYLKRKILSGV